MYVENIGNSIHLFGRNEDGSRYSRKEHFKNYLYSDVPRGTCNTYKTLFDNEVEKRYYDEFNRKEIFQLIESNHVITYEADVPLRVRYCLDTFDEIPEEPLRVCMLDIEVDDSEGYPDMNVFDKEITSICCHDNMKNKMHVFYVEPHKDKEQTIRTETINYYSFESEHALLDTFVSFMCHMDFDLIWAWNGDGFDYPYIFGRMKINGIEPEKLSPLKRCGYRDGKPVGRYWLDLMEAFKKLSTHKSESYSLDYIGKEVTGKGKVEHEGKVGDLWRENTDLFLEYNINDVQLMVEIEKKKGIIKYFDTIRRLTFCSFYDVFFNSRVLDCYFLKKAKKMGIVLPNKPKYDGKYDPIEGARVIPPIPGLHHYVAVGDVRSLYPTAFLTCNMSPETIDPKGDIKVGPTKFKSNPRGFIPIIIQELWDLRQEWKSEMKKYPKGSPEYEMWDNLQTVCKFLLNSIYGVMLMPGFRLFRKEIGAAITLFGRNTNIHMENQIKAQGYEVLAGDSITGDMKVSGKPISEYFTQVDYISPDGKEYCYNTFKTDTIDDNGNTVLGDVKYIMRHKTNKKIYRIHLTNQEHLDVTEDHSIYAYANRTICKSPNEVDHMHLIKPEQLGGKYTTLIGQIYVNRELITPTDYPDELYVLFGLFLGDGNFKGLPKYKFNVRLACGLDKDEIVEKVILPLMELGWIDRWTNEDKHGSIAMYGKVKDELNKYMNNGGIRKMVPRFMFNDTEEHIALFLRGFFSADGTISNRHNISGVSCSQVDEEIINDIKYLLLCCGINSSLSKIEKENHINGISTGTHTYICYVYNTNCYKEKIGFVMDRKTNKFLIRKNERQTCVQRCVSKIEVIDYNDYVYDIEVADTHKFFANGILVHNTDSIIFKVGEDNPQRAKDAVENVNATFDQFCLDNFGTSEYNRMFLEFDKMYKSILFVKKEDDSAVKKRYAGLIYVSDGKMLDEPILDVKGFDSKRSDTPTLVRDLQKEVFVMILNGAEKKEVKGYVQSMRRKITEGEYEPHSIAIPKGMSKTITDYDKTIPIHITGAKYYNEYCGGNIKKEKLKYLYVKRVPANYPKTHVVSFVDKTPEGFVWDLEKMAEKLIDEKFKNIFHSLGWGDQSTLDIFF